MSRAGGSEPTIRSVAEHAGVSKSLVSLVLRGSPKVSDARRQAVLDAVEALGYRPNAAARSLSERRTRSVGVVVGDLRNPWHAESLEGLDAALSPSGLTLLLGDGRRDAVSVLDAFVDMRADGLVLLGSMPPSTAMAEAARRIPTVVAGSRDFDLPGVAFPPVDVSAQDDHLGATLATEHLIGLGHRRIAHLGHDPAVAVSVLRRAAYVATMRAHGLEPVVESCDMDEDGGHRAALRVLAAAPRPTAVFAANDMVAVGTLAAAADLGLSVPEDLSVVGYDNTLLARLRPVGLTSVEIASVDVGRLAGELLLARIAAPERPATVRLAEPSVVARTSSGPPPG